MYMYTATSPFLVSTLYVATFLKKHGLYASTGAVEGIDSGTFISIRPKKVTNITEQKQIKKHYAHTVRLFSVG